MNDTNTWFRVLNNRQECSGTIENPDKYQDHDMSKDEEIVIVIEAAIES